jgi:hypothetical protein
MRGDTSGSDDDEDDLPLAELFSIIPARVSDGEGFR